MIRKVLYGWRLRSGIICLGTNPPDAPAMSYTPYFSRQEAQAAAERKRARIIWCDQSIQPPGEHR